MKRQLLILATVVAITAFVGLATRSTRQLPSPGVEPSVSAGFEQLKAERETVLHAYTQTLRSLPDLRERQSRSKLRLEALGPAQREEMKSEAFQARLNAATESTEPEVAEGAGLTSIHGAELTDAEAAELGKLEEEIRSIETHLPLIAKTNDVTLRMELTLQMLGE